LSGEAGWLQEIARETRSCELKEDPAIDDSVHL